MSTSTEARSEYITRRFLVSGRVQGVYFRHSTRIEAQRLGIGGIARNLPDGSVEVIAHGARIALDALKTWLAVGPPSARVTGVEELAAAPPDLESFRTSASFSVE